MSNCRLSIKNNIVDHIIEGSIIKPYYKVIKRLNQYTVGIGYSPNFENIKTRDQALATAIRITNQVNKQFNSDKFGETAKVDSSLPLIKVRINPTEKLLDYYELKAYQENNNLETIEAKRLLERNKIRNNNEANPETLFQLESKGIPDEQLDEKIKDSLRKMHSDVSFIDTITNKEGNPINDIVARAKYVKEGLKSIVEVVKKKSGLDTLTEEASHIMIWMLRGTPLHRSMYDDIDKYPEYKQVLLDYKDKYTTDLQFREEAMSKLITSRVISLNESGITKEQYYRVTSWFKRVLNWLEQRIKEYFSDPYNKAAGKLLFGDLDDISHEKITESEEAYQVEENKEETQQGESKRQKNLDKIKEVTKKLKEENNNLTVEEKSGKHIYKNGDYTFSTSVTELRDSQEDFPTRTATQKIKDEFTRSFGTDGHNDFKNAITRAIEEKQGAIITPKIAKLDDTSYEKIEEFAKEFVNSYPADAQFFVEYPIGDKSYGNNKGIAGTPDIFVIYLDSNDEIKLDVFDWKFIDYKKDNGRVTQQEMYKRKKEGYQFQIVKYRQILEVNGLKFEGKSRLLPIDVNLVSTFDEHGNFTGYKRGSIEVGTLTYNNRKLYLSPVPLETEKTGNETVDTIVKNLINQRSSIEKQSTSNEKERANQQRRITKLNEVIKELILTESIKSFLNDAQAEIDSFNRNDLSDQELAYIRELLSFYKGVNTANYRNNLSLEEYNKIKDSLNNFRNKVEDLEKFIEHKLKERVIQIANSEGVEDINTPQKDIGWWQKNLRNFSQQNHPLIKSLYQLVIKAKDATLKDHNILQEKIKEANKKVIEYASSHGIKSDETYNFMVVRDKKGNIKQINKYKSEIWENIKKAKENNNISNIKEYYTFNKEKYDQALIEEENYWKESYKYLENDKLINEEVAKRKIIFENTYNVNKNINAYFTKYNKFLNLKEENNLYSEEYKHIQDTPELKEFYDLFNSFITNSREWLDVDIDNHFIPQIPMGYIEQVANSGLGAIQGMKETFVNSILAKQQGLYGEVNPNTGEIYKSIPVYYTSKIGKLASTDLSKVFSLWANMAYTNKHLQEVEGAAKLLYEAMKEEEFIQTDIFGNAKTIDGKEVVVKALNSKTLEAFNNYINEAFYGINMVDKDKVFELNKKKKVLDKEGNEVLDEEGNPKFEKYKVPISAMKVFNKVLSLTSAKALALNFIGAGANLSGNIANGIYEGTKELFYGRKEFLRSIGWMASGNINPVTQTILRYFNIMDDMEVFNKADSLSVYKANKFFTMDRAYTLYKGGDHIAHNAVLLSMMQTHGIEEDGKIKHLRNLPEGTKSLYQLANVSEGKLEIKGLTDKEDDKEYRNFRRKVFEIGKRITGLAPTYDIRLINQTVLGKAAMMFRNWIPRMLDERTAKLNYNKNLDFYEEGKYITTWNFLVKEGFLNNATKLLALNFGIGNIEQELKLKYQTLSQVEKNKVTEQDYIALQKGNIKSTLMEIQTILAVFLMFLALKPDKDETQEDLTGVRKYTVKMLDKLFNEVSFFVNPVSASQIIGSPFPVTRFATDIYNLGINLGGEVTGDIIGDQEMQDKYKPLKYFGKNIPYFSELTRDMQFITDDKYWNK